MKTTVTVTVLQPFHHKGQSYHPGQAITLTPIDAVVLAKKRHVSLAKRKAVPEPTPPSPLPQPEPEPEPDVVKPKRHYYKRRDVQAEDLAPIVPVQSFDPEPEPTADADAE